MNQFILKQIGKIEMNDEGIFIKVEKAFIPALRSLEGFSHINVFWWFHDCDDEPARHVLEVESPYKGSPAVMGTFATRSPQRPNPIALTAAQIMNIDHAAGTVQIAYIDAKHGSPVIDLKPYTPSLDRIENPGVPGWCRHWPKSLEESSDFAWEDEFNF